ncbi:MAG TPA: homogentisate 1,2-dioxygenase [Wenzhouxiangellaceae bacterium]|nr:homogentisate 1,2-dioxygenase [Wenzhouxiangellaceae bacterium]
MKNWITHPKVEGDASRQAHCDLPEGTYERELGKEGFFGPASHMYHANPPTGWTNFDGPLRPRAFDTTRLETPSGSPWDAAELMHNAHTRIRSWQSPGGMDHLARNSDGDELLFVHAGAGELYCDYGRMEFRDGDYIMLPRGTMWRLASDAALDVLMIEATNSSYMLPDKGILGPHAIFDPAMLDTPTIDEKFKAQQGEAQWDVVVKRRNQLSTISYPFNPLDAVGWHGDLVPVKINWRDIRPLMSHRYHLPPSAHTTFIANRFVVCTFVPRPFETDPGALKVPFFHNNDDYDELIFYHAGNFFSRDNIHPGMMTLHPCGFTHGPHPKALKNAFEPKAEGTEEVAVMIDTRDALDVTDEAGTVEWKEYVDSWKGK